MRKRELLVKLKPIINLSILVLKFLPRRVRLFFLNLIQNMSGVLAIGLRYVLLKALIKSCGENVSIHKSVILLGLENLEIGNNVSIHPFCYIDATGGLKIGSDVSVAHNSTMLSTEHIYSDINIPIKDQGVKGIQTIVGNNVWIGCGVRVLAGSNINDGSIAAAGTVIKGTIKSNAIYGGVPAKFLKDR